MERQLHDEDKCHRQLHLEASHFPGLWQGLMAQCRSLEKSYLFPGRLPPSPLVMWQALPGLVLS